MLVLSCSNKDAPKYWYMGLKVRPLHVGASSSCQSRCIALLHVVRQGPAPPLPLQPPRWCALHFVFRQWAPLTLHWGELSDKLPQGCRRNRELWPVVGSASCYHLMGWSSVRAGFGGQPEDSPVKWQEERLEKDTRHLRCTTDCSEMKQTPVYLETQIVNKQPQKLSILLENYPL